MYDSALHVVIRVPDDVDELVLTRILLTRLLKAVDEKLREQAGVRKDRSFTDQIAVLRIIIEQSLKWNTSLFLNFVDFEKVFDSLDREVLSTAIWSVKDRSFLTPACSLSFSSTAFNSLVRSILVSTFATTDNSTIPL
jgi:hypothetical protein